MAVDKKNVDYNKGIEERNISEACTEYMQIFGSNNNLMRHLPGVLDGCKIGERRILYTMWKLGLNYNKPFLKVASIVGNTLSYHPHGEAAVADTLVRMGQHWNNTQCMVEGSGNFGSISGSSAASGRYIEARLSYYAYKCFFEDFSEDIIDTKMNYLGTEIEPEYLPAKYPNALINNVFSIGYGVSSSICTYNLKEVLEATIELIQDPDIENIVLYPDSATGAHIIDEGQFESISKTGKGRFKMRGVIDIDDENNILHIRSTPLMVYWEKIKKSVFDILTDGKNSLMKDFKDESDIGHMHYKVFLKKEVDPYSVVNTIYSKTQMEKSFPVNFKLIEDYEDNDYNIKSLLQVWIDFRRDTKRRYYNHKLLKSRERQHILSILLFILNKDNAENTIKIIKKSENNKEIVSKLMKTYGISSLQATTIANMRMSAFSKEAYRKYQTEKEEIDKEVEKLEKIVRSSKKIDKIIIDELKEGIKLFGEERRSKIITIDNEVKIRNTNHTIVFTNNGYVKKLPEDVSNIGYLEQGDYPIEVIHANNTSELLIFDASGKISKLPVHKLQGVALTNIGNKLSEFITTSGKIVGVRLKPTEEFIDNLKEPLYYLMVTKNGIIKKTAASAYVNIKNELLGIILNDGDELLCVKPLLGDKDIITFSEKGFGVRYHSTEVRETSRLSKGVIAGTFSENDRIVGLDILNKNDKYIMVITNKGNMKKCSLDTFKTMNRMDKPLRIVSIDNNDSIFKIRTIRGNEKFKVYTKENIVEFKAEDVIELPRMSKCKKMIPVNRGNMLVELVED